MWMNNKTGGHIPFASPCLSRLCFDFASAFRSPPWLSFTNLAKFHNSNKQKNKCQYQAVGVVVAATETKKSIQQLT
jgi:hypothetical protein